MRTKRRNIFDRMRILRRVTRPVEAAQVRVFGRSLLSVVFGTRVLLLHTVGRRSGVERTTPLAFHIDADGSLLVVGGAGGQVRVPDWVANLRANPAAAVTMDRHRFDVRAEELCGRERAAVCRSLVLVWPQIETYERRAGRDVPVYRLIKRSTPTLKRAGECRAR